MGGGTPPQTIGKQYGLLEARASAEISQLALLERWERLQGCLLSAGEVMCEWRAARAVGKPSWTNTVDRVAENVSRTFYRVTPPQNSANTLRRRTRFPHKNGVRICLHCIF